MSRAVLSTLFVSAYVVLRHSGARDRCVFINTGTRLATYSTPLQRALHPPNSSHKPQTSSSPVTAAYANEAAGRSGSAESSWETVGSLEDLKSPGWGPGWGPVPPPAAAGPANPSR